MRNKNDSGISEKIYRQLLKFYPRAFREEFGKSMEQVFHDQCVEKRKTSGLFGLLVLWLRVIPDLIFTSMKEHIAAFLSLLKTSTHHLVFEAPIWKPPLSVSIIIIAVISMVTFSKTPLYEGSARFRLRHSITDNNPEVTLQVSKSDTFSNHATIALAKSYEVGSRVIEKLNLNEIYQSQMNRKQPLSTQETYALLFNKHFKIEEVVSKYKRPTYRVKNPDAEIARDIAMEIGQASSKLQSQAAIDDFYLSHPEIEVLPIEKGNLLRIKVLNPAPEVAAAIANEILRTVRETQRQTALAELIESNPNISASDAKAQRYPLDIIDIAIPDTRAKYPNVYLEIFLGMAASTIIGGTILIALVLLRKRHQNLQETNLHTDYQM